MVEKKTAKEKGHQKNEHSMQCLLERHIHVKHDSDQKL